MCGRYFFDDKIENEIENELNLPKGSYASDRGDITPGMETKAVLWKRDVEEIKVSPLFWDIKSRDNKLIINARSESVAEKNMFADSVKNRRCILPAAGFYEWDKDKTKFIFKSKDGSPIYLAGFYDLSSNRDSFVILTTSANISMEPVHDRMPVIIDKGAVRDYLKDYTIAMDMISEPMPELSRSSDYEQLSLF